MPTRVKVTKHPHCPPPLPIDGWIVAVAGSMATIHMYIETADFSGELELERQAFGTGDFDATGRQS